ncbi:MAG: flagellar hook basal-body protein [Planctomycetota bacterium]|nr:flagellar hook basal-body protein [Planctomycetota bacterium]
MIYGLWQSATGILTNSYRQDVISNNIANSETVGFKKDLAMLRQRATAAEERGLTGNNPGNSQLENLGGGMLVEPTEVDNSQGELELTGNNLDLALHGHGYFGVTSGGQLHLTRAGQFLVNRDGNLVLSNDVGQSVLDINQQPIHLSTMAPVTVDSKGAVTQNGKTIAKIGMFDVSDPKQLQKEGGTLMSIKDGAAVMPASAEIRSQYIERSNVEPATELSSLMDAQRQLQANANMIQYQDQTLDKLINDAGKIS